MTSRRTVLAATGIAIGLAGCSGTGDPDGDTSADDGAGMDDGAGTDDGTEESADETADDTESEQVDDEPEPDGVRLGDVLLQGTDGEEAHSVQIAVEGASGVVHLDTYAVAPGAPAVRVDREWDDTFAAYRINVRVDGQDRRTIDVIAQSERAGGCADVLIVLDADGGVSVWDRSCADVDGEGEDDESGDDENGDDE